MDFKTLEGLIRNKEGNESPIKHDTITLCFDPGHTTGYAVFKGLNLEESGQLTTEPIEHAVVQLQDCIQLWGPEVVVFESYRVYKWKAKHHGGSEMLTTRVIGCIETLCVIEGVRNIIKQPAHIGKGFCTDTRLKEWGLYVPGKPHARDAVRHGCHFLLFGAINSKDRKGYVVG